MTTSTIALPSPLPLKPKKRIQRTRGQWKSLVDEFTASGLTKVAFCKKRGIATSCFHRWQQVFAGQSAAGEFIDITEPIAAVASLPSVEGNADWQVELELGAGMFLRLRTR
ncbi:MAG: hypothetical protein HOC23_13500 [Halieaceae bacterium]|jgi:hypothetical protein|nr:hypothetical protein [Halieaceae bacterium]